MEIYLEHGLSSEANVQTLKVNDVDNEDVGCQQLHDDGVDKVNEVVNKDVGCEQLNDVGVDKVNEVVNDMQAEHGSDVPNTVEVEAEAESDASEQSIKDVDFDDSEEERALGVDDWFNYGDVGQAEAGLNEKLKNMKKGVRGTKERGETS
ncbi:putative radical SAM protein [Sesbania bispinosa]|nr:putative radical SAM protein [Sesbania bispinosa]